VDQEKEIVVETIAESVLSHAATFVMAGSASAEEHQIRVTVPFNFLVGDQLLPSGNYRISSRRSSPEVLSIGNREKNVHIVAKGQTTQSGASNTDELVFHKYRSLYFLTDIQFAHSPTRIHFPATAAEKRMQAQTEGAGLSPNEPVLIEPAGELSVAFA
jgi:hypothetical protein